MKRMYANNTRLSMLFLLLAVVAVAQTPQSVLDLFRVAAQALAERDVRGFLEQFDPAMKGYDVLRQRAALLMGAESSVEIVRDEGDDRRREMQIDWLLRVGSGASKRRILNVTVERQGRAWKITALDPVEFFSRD